jgi:hypothetical protein
MAAMPILRLHVRPEDWERKEWRERFETELEKIAWRIQAVEPPSPARAAYVYLLVRAEDPDPTPRPAGARRCGSRRTERDSKDGLN